MLVSQRRLLFVRKETNHSQLSNMKGKVINIITIKEFSFVLLQSSRIPEEIQIAAQEVETRAELGSPDKIYQFRYCASPQFSIVWNYFLIKARRPFWEGCQCLLAVVLLTVTGISARFSGGWGDRGLWRRGQGFEGVSQDKQSQKWIVNESQKIP